MHVLLLQCLEYAGRVYTVGYHLIRSYPVVRQVQRMIQELEDLQTPAGLARLNYLLSNKLPAAEARACDLCVATRYCVDASLPADAIVLSVTERDCVDRSGVQREFELATVTEHRQQLKEQRVVANARPAVAFSPNKRQQQTFRTPPFTTMLASDGKWCRNWVDSGACNFGNTCKWSVTHVTQNAPSSSKPGVRGG